MFLQIHIKIAKSTEMSLQICQRRDFNTNGVSNVKNHNADVQISTNKTKSRF